LTTRKLRKLGALAAAALTIVGTSGAKTPGFVSVDRPAAVTESADVLFREAMKAPKRVSFVGELSTIRWGTTGAVANVSRIEHRAPDQTRRLYLAPQSLYGDYVVRHGSQSYEFDVNHDRVVSSSNPALNNEPEVRDRAQLLAENYHAVMGATEPIAGRSALTVSLINKYTGVRTMRVWIDSKTKLVLGREMYHADGSLAMRIRFDDIRYTGKIPDSVFSTSVPHGYSAVSGPRYAEPMSGLAVVARVAGFTLQSPRFLPDGFALVSSAVTTVKGIRSVHLIYSDGLRNISLFENDRNAAADFGTLKPTATTVEENAAAYVKDGPTTLLSWREHGLAFALVGDLDVSELRQIAASVVPD